MDQTSPLLSLGQYPSAQNIASILALPSSGSGLQMHMSGSMSNSASSLDPSSSGSMQSLLAFQFQQQQLQQQQLQQQQLQQQQFQQPQMGSTMLQPNQYQQQHSMRTNNSASLDLIARANLSSSSYQDSLQYPLQPQQLQQYLSSYMVPSQRASVSSAMQPDPVPFSFPVQRSAPTVAPVSTSLYIKNLPLDADKLFLYEKFSPYGAILSVKVLVNEESGKCRGVGFVNFSERASAVRAVHNLNGLVVGHSALHVSLQEQQLIPSAYMPWLAGST